jgi:hypothetical protein
VIEDHSLFLEAVESEQPQNEPVSVFSFIKPEPKEPRVSVASVSSLADIEEEHKGISGHYKGDYYRTRNSVSDGDSAIFIPNRTSTHSPSSKRTSHTMGRSRTLPLETTGFRRYQSLPMGTNAVGSKSLHTNSSINNSAARERAKSEEKADVVQRESPSSEKHGNEIEDVFMPVLQGPVVHIGEEQTVRVSISATEETEKYERLNGPCAEDSDERTGDIVNTESQESSSRLVTKGLEQGIRRSPNLKDERSSSSESSRTSKSRADSFNTDSTTSGVSSYDSGAPHTGTDFVSLSPIPSTNSIDTLGSLEDVTVTLREKNEPVHPSTVQRRLANLNRVPSSRSSRTSILPSTRFADAISTESALQYTTSRDALGYATLRSIQGQRNSIDLGSDYGLSKLYDEDRNSRHPSMDSHRSVDSYYSSRLG